MPRDERLTRPADPAACLAEALRPLRAGARIVLAVSGGADSLAMLVLAAAMRDRLGSGTPDICVATVDHGLRPESAGEAAFVARVAAGLGLPHATLPWRGWDGRGNLQGAAREARYRLLSTHAIRLGASVILVAHHEDDQIETHRLAIARGGEGPALAGMRAIRDLAPGLVLLRPFLRVPAAALREALAGTGLTPLLDPSNADTRFARARLRARRAPSSRERAAFVSAIDGYAALRTEADAALLAALGQGRTDAAGLYRLGTAGFDALGADLAARLVSRAATAVGGADGPPPRAASMRLATRLRGARDGFAATLAGCRVARSGGEIVFSREWGRVGPPVVAVDLARPRHVFDNRFDVTLAPGFREGGAARLVSLGHLGLGDARERALPVLLDAEGGVLAAYEAVQARLKAPGRPLPCRSRVGWRLLADLAGEVAVRGG